MIQNMHIGENTFLQQQTDNALINDDRNEKLTGLNCSLMEMFWGTICKHDRGWIFIFIFITVQ